MYFTFQYNLLLLDGLGLAINILYYKILHTVGENIIATTKIRNNFCYPLRMVMFSIIAIAILNFSQLLPI